MNQLPKPPGISARLLRLGAVASLLFVAVPLSAQDDVGSSPPSHPHAFGIADGGDGSLETGVTDLRIPMGFTLFQPTDDKWGLRLRLIAYAGVYDFTTEEGIDLDLRFKSFAATPGVEFLFPAWEAWIFKPFAEVGFGRDFDNALSFGLWSVGMRTLATWPVKRWALSFGTKIQYLSTFTSDIAFDDDYGEIRLGFDARHPLGLTIAGAPADLSGYFIRRQYVDALIERDEGEPLEIRYTNEVGLTFGTTPKSKVWSVSLPRIGLGYRWSPHIRGWRINFGFPF